MNRKQQRFDAAVSVAQGLSANPESEYTGSDWAESIARHSVKVADALLAEIERTAPKEEPIKCDPTPISPSVMPQTVTVLCTVDNAKGWIERIPGDPIPDASMVRFADGLEEDGNGWSEANWNHRYAEHRCRITHYKPA